MNSNGANLALSSCLVTSPFWCHAIEIISTGASFIAAVTGAVIGVITLWKMIKKGFNAS